MNCKNCGAPLKNGAKFCTGCGQTVKTADVPAMGYAQNPYAQNPVPQNPVPQNPYVQNPGPQNQFSVPVPPPTSNFYPNQPQQAGGTAGIKMFFVFFMIFALLMSAVGLMRFPIAASSEMDTIVEYTNMTSIALLWNADEGKIGDMIEDTVEGFEDVPLFTIGFFISIIVFFAVIIIGVIAFVFCLAGSHSGAASMTGIGLLVLALGYLGCTFEAINMLSELSDNDKARIGVMPIVMIVVCIVTGVFAFISAKKMKKTG